MKTIATEQVVASIAEIAERRKPREAVGYLIGETVVELENIAEEEDLAAVDVQQMMAVMATLGHESVFAEDLILWHTHPRGNIGPSKTDMNNRVDGVRYLVVALTPDGPVGTRY